MSALAVLLLSLALAPFLSDRVSGGGASGEAPEAGSRQAGIDELRSASPQEAGGLFLRLGLPHYRGAVPVAGVILEDAGPPDPRQFAQAVGSEPDHGSHTTTGPSLSRQEIAAGLAHGTTQGSAAFLVGLVAFVVLAWLPATRAAGMGGATGPFVLCIWALSGVLVISGVVELSLYAVRASGEPFGLGLLWQALSGTQTGYFWLERICLGLLTAAAATWAARQPRQPSRWWVAAGLGGVLLATLTRQSHAAAEEGLLPVLADWLHVAAASVWMGGLLGLPLLLLGPLRAMPTKQRSGLLRRTVRRFSRIAILAVATITITGAYATLIHIPNLSALLGTSYGHALLMKLGMLVLVLAAGGMNLTLEGREPFERLVWFELILALGVFVATGFLTTLPPPAGVSP